MYGKRLRLALPFFLGFLRADAAPIEIPEQQFEDLSLAARVNASLGASPECSGWAFNVRAESGHVYISAVDPSGVSQTQVVKVAERVPGVNQVTTDFGGYLS